MLAQLTLALARPETAHILPSSALNPAHACSPAVTPSKDAFTPTTLVMTTIHAQRIAANQMALAAMFKSPTVCHVAPRPALGQMHAALLHATTSAQFAFLHP